MPASTRTGCDQVASPSPKEHRRNGACARKRVHPAQTAQKLGKNRGGKATDPENKRWQQAGEYWTHWGRGKSLKEIDALTLLKTTATQPSLRTQHKTIRIPLPRIYPSAVDDVHPWLLLSRLKLHERPRCVVPRHLALLRRLEVLPVRFRVRLGGRLRRRHVGDKRVRRQGVRDVRGTHGAHHLLLRRQKRKSPREAGVRHPRPKDLRCFGLGPRRRRCRSVFLPRCRCLGGFRVVRRLRLVQGGHRRERSSHPRRPRPCGPRCTRLSGCVRLHGSRRLRPPGSITPSSPKPVTIA